MCVKLSCLSSPLLPCQVYIGGIQDLRPDSTGASKCSRLVDAAATYGASTFKRAQFLVSVLWWDSGPRDPPAGYNGCQNYTLSSEQNPEWFQADLCMVAGQERQAAAAVPIRLPRPIWPSNLNPGPPRAFPCSLLLLLPL